VELTQCCKHTIESTEHECRDEGDCRIWSDEPSYLLETSDMIEAHTDNFVHVLLLHCELGVKHDTEVTHNVHRCVDITVNL